ncbi:MAG: anti-sigma factor [Rhizobiaceae bacterium]
MTLVDDNGSGINGDDALAAEYVVGVLPADERRAATARIERDGAFAGLVDGWEVYFAPLASAYAAVEPPASVKVAIDRRLFASGAAAPSSGSVDVPSGGLWASLAFWRGLATAALAALVIYAGTTLLREPAVQPPVQQLVASLGADGSDVRFLAVYDPSSGEVGLVHLAGEPAQGRVHELWVIEGQNAPVSMGVIPASAGRLAVNDANRARLAAGSVLAISLEPTGGSPTGQPTGPVVAAGPLNNI